MSAPEEVTAEVIEPVNLAKAPEPAIKYTLPVAEVTNVEAVEKYVSSIEAFFGGVEIGVTDPEQVKQLSKLRADINKVADAINKKRIAMDKDVKSAVSEADGVLNGLRDRVRAVYAATGKQIDEAERIRTTARMNLLKGEYEAVAPDLMKVVPLSALIAREPDLMTKKWKGNKACDVLDGLVAEAVAERKTLEGLEFANEADMVFCRTLDVAAALAENARLVKARDDAKSHKAAADEMARKLAENATPKSPALEHAMDRAAQAVKAANPTPAPVQLYEWELTFTGSNEHATMVRDYVTQIGAKGKSIKGRKVDG